MEEIIKEYIKAREEAARKLIAAAKSGSQNYYQVKAKIRDLRWDYSTKAHGFFEQVDDLLFEEMNDLKVD
jgi:hypothetical protein